PRHATETTHGQTGSAKDPLGGHHIRPKSTGPRASEASGAHDRDRGGRDKRPPWGVTTYGQSLRTHERAKRAAHATETGGGEVNSTPMVQRKSPGESENLPVKREQTLPAEVVAREGVREIVEAELEDEEATDALAEVTPATDEELDAIEAQLVPSRL